jgi:hypothetical protein
MVKCLLGWNGVTQTCPGIEPLFGLGKFRMKGKPATAILFLCSDKHLLGVVLLLYHIRVNS